MIKLDGLQEKRKELINHYFTKSQLPDEYFDLTNQLNEETEANVYLNKDVVEQRITIQALKDVLKGHSDYLDTLKKIYKEYNKNTELSLEDLNDESMHYDEQHQILSNQKDELSDQLEIMKANIPSKQHISPRKFDDKFVLDD